MKTTIARIALLAAAGFTLAACQQGNGALSQGAVRATLAARTLTITPSEPEWLLQAGEQHKLSEAQRAKLDAAAPRLYKDSVREYARTRYIMGDTVRARAWCKKIKESLPSRDR